MKKYVSVLLINLIFSLSYGVHKNEINLVDIVSSNNEYKKHYNKNKSSRKNIRNPIKRNKEGKNEQNFFNFMLKVKNSFNKEALLGISVITFGIFLLKYIIIDAPASSNNQENIDIRESNQEIIPSLEEDTKDENEHNSNLGDEILSDNCDVNNKEIQDSEDKLKPMDLKKLGTDSLFIGTILATIGLLLT